MTAHVVSANPTIPVTFTVSGSTSTFDFDFPWWDSGDIIVLVDDEALDSSEFTVDGGPNDGTVTLNTPVTSGTVAIDRRVVADLTSGLSTTGPLSVTALNSQLARLTARDQDNARWGADAVDYATEAAASATAATAAVAAISTLTQSHTIASDTITVTSAYVPNLVSLDTEAAAATDNLATISGGLSGQVIFLRSTTATRVITVKDGTGNIQLPGGDFTLDSGNDMLMLVKSSTSWRAPAAGGNNN